MFHIQPVMESCFFMSVSRDSWCYLSKSTACKCLTIVCMIWSKLRGMSWMCFPCFPYHSARHNYWYEQQPLEIEIATTLICVVGCVHGVYMFMLLFHICFVYFCFLQLTTLIMFIFVLFMFAYVFVFVHVLCLITRLTTFKDLML